MNRRSDGTATSSVKCRCGVRGCNSTRQTIRYSAVHTRGWSIRDRRRW